MRTTIELRPEHRERLVKIAASRGQKGLSSVVSEAIDVYLGLEAQREKQQHRALELKGILSPKEVQNLRKEAESIRDSWR